jgi:hypothetical protein
MKRLPGIIFLISRFENLKNTKISLAYAKKGFKGFKCFRGIVSTASTALLYPAA